MREIDIPRFLSAVLLLPCLGGCTFKTGTFRDTKHLIEVSVPEQKMALYRKGKMVVQYPIATSKFGLGDTEGSYRTPLGKFEVARKIGEGKPLGAVFKRRVWTGEILKPNSPGRDPIVSRILWLNGLEEQNKNAFERYIYIHGTAAEHEVGRKTSYGCIRMKSKDIMDLYDGVGLGTEVKIVERPLWEGIESLDPEPLWEEIDLSVSVLPSHDYDLFSNPLDREVVVDEILIDLESPTDLPETNLEHKAGSELAPASID